MLPEKELNDLEVPTGVEHVRVHPVREEPADGTDQIELLELGQISDTIG